MIKRAISAASILCVLLSGFALGAVWDHKYFPPVLMQILPPGPPAELTALHCFQVLTVGCDLARIECLQVHHAPRRDPGIELRDKTVREF